jgi:CBS-domain-containing membrane protein
MAKVGLEHARGLLLQHLAETPPCVEALARREGIVVERATATKASTFSGSTGSSTNSRLQSSSSLHRRIAMAGLTRPWKSTARSTVSGIAVRMAWMRPT